MSLGLSFESSCACTDVTDPRLASRATAAAVAHANMRMVHLSFE
jgi:hypothetical protein